MFMSVQEHVYRAMSESIVEEAAPSRDGGLDRRVRKGAELLDEQHPGWADKIDLRRFNIRESSKCVIGQVFGDYEIYVYGVLDIDVPENDEIVAPEEEEFGFCLTKCNDSEDWEVLEEDWEIAIRERQVA